MTKGNQIIFDSNAVEYYEKYELLSPRTSAEETSPKPMLTWLLVFEQTGLLPDIIKKAIEQCKEASSEEKEKYIKNINALSRFPNEAVLRYVIESEINGKSAIVDSKESQEFQQDVYNRLAVSQMQLTGATANEGLLQYYKIPLRAVEESVPNITKTPLLLSDLQALSLMHMGFSKKLVESGNPEANISREQLEILIEAKNYLASRGQALSSKSTRVDQFNQQTKNKIKQMLGEKAFNDIKKKSISELVFEFQRVNKKTPVTNATVGDLQGLMQPDEMSSELDIFKQMKGLSIRRYKKEDPLISLLFDGKNPPKIADFAGALGYDVRFTEATRYVKNNNGSFSEKKFGNIHEYLEYQGFFNREFTMGDIKSLKDNKLVSEDKFKALSGAVIANSTDWNLKVQDELKKIWSEANTDFNTAIKEISNDNELLTNLQAGKNPFDIIEDQALATQLVMKAALNCRSAPLSGAILQAASSELADSADLDLHQQATNEMLIGTKDRNLRDGIETGIADPYFRCSGPRIEYLLEMRSKNPLPGVAMDPQRLMEQVQAQQKSYYGIKEPGNPQRKKPEKSAPNQSFTEKNDFMTAFIAKNSDVFEEKNHQGHVNFVPKGMNDNVTQQNRDVFLRNMTRLLSGDGYTLEEYYQNNNGSKQNRSTGSPRITKEEMMLVMHKGGVCHFKPLSQEQAADITKRIDDSKVVQEIASQVNLMLGKSQEVVVSGVQVLGFEKQQSINSVQKTQEVTRE